MNKHTLWKVGLLALSLAVSACGPDDTGGTKGVADLGPSTADQGGDMNMPEDMNMPDQTTTPEDMGVDMNIPEDMGMDAGDDDMGADMMPGDMGMDAGMDMNMPPEPCDTNADCSAPEVCTLDSATGDKLCTDPVGNGMTGDACSMGSDCASNICINGACANPCQASTDCPNGYVCESQTVALSDGSNVSINACVEAPQPCLANSDCTDPEVCVVSSRNGNSVELTCETPVPGGGDLGDACVADSDCLSALCIDSVCAEPCQRPSDCSSDGSFICEPADNLTSAGSPVNVCKPKPPTQCLSNSACASPEQCVAERGQTAIDFTCGDANVGGGAVGDSCTMDSECAQNLCLGGVCAPPCQSNGDCNAAQDYTCEVQTVQLAGGGTDTAQVCTPPVVCASSDECKISEACYVRRNASDVDTICRTPNVGGGSLGQICNTDAECASNLCYESRFGKVCSKPCDSASQCNVTGYTCSTVDVDTASGGETSAQICAPQTPTACTSNDDCQTGTSCAIVTNEAGNALESVCIPSTGRLATGVACGQDSDCESRTCLGGSCADPCTDSNQCGARQLCLNNSITKGGVTQNFDVCERLQDQACSSSDACTDGVRVCGELRQTGQGIEAFCKFPNTGQSLLGADCSTGNECYDGICLSTIDECSVACDEDTDCSLAQNQICSTFLFTQSSSIDLCVRGCTDNGSCTTGDVCTINDDETNNDIDQICTEPVGPGLLGDECTSGGDCDTGLCLTTVLYNGTTCSADSECDVANGESCRCPIDQPNCASGKQCSTATNRCSRICNDDTDCAGGASTGNQLTTCSTDVNVTLPDGNGTKQISLCGQPS